MIITGVGQHVGKQQEMLNHPGPAHSWKIVMSLNLNGQVEGVFIRTQNPVGGAREEPPRKVNTSGGGL